MTALCQDTPQGKSWLGSAERRASQQETQSWTPNAITHLPQSCLPSLTNPIRIGNTFIMAKHTLAAAVVGCYGEKKEHCPVNRQATSARGNHVLHTMWNLTTNLSIIPRLQILNYFFFSYSNDFFPFSETHGNPKLFPSFFFKFKITVKENQILKAKMPEDKQQEFIID